jgi:uracil-DNA glycosylase family 4
MDEAKDIAAGLRRWVQQQRAGGVEELLLPPAPPRAAAASPVSAAAGPSAASALAPEATPADPALRATLLSRHPAWADSPLLPLAEEIDACRRCNLGAQRHCSVPGTGNPRAKLVFVGEAPGAEEDRQGIPFVGRAGQLLDKILAAIELRREDVHILNILKCRPPENRNPAPLEIEACRPFLERQLDLIEPGILVALGLFAGQWLTGKKLSLTKLRESGPHRYRDIPVFATYHPAALLRNPNWKRPAWEDFKLIREEYKKL